MNESGTEDQDQFEPVLLVPPRLTKSSYATLLSLDCVPRKWHLAGRHGSRTHKILDDDNDASVRGGRIGIPLIKSPENIQLITSMMANKNVNDGCKHEHDHEHADLQNLLSTPGVELIFKPPVPSNKIPKEEILDATIHPNRKPDGYQLKLKEILQQAASSSSSSSSSSSAASLEVNNSKHIIRPWKRNKPSSEHELQTPAFTFCELFAGIGGFGIALEALGGKCVFASEIYEPSKRLYEANLDVTHLNPNPNVPGVPPSISGDIWDIQSKDIPPHDLLVGGFPCQPFSTLGDQPGLQDGKHSSGRKNTKGTQCVDGDGCGDGGSGSGSGRGQLFTQIARILRDVQPKAFLLENVPGLITTDGGNALKTIISTLEEVGYRVSFEVCSSRGLTAQSRKRLYIVGLRKRKEQEQEQEQDRNTGFAVGLSGAAKDKPFQFPFIPDLQLRAGDVLHTPEELACATSQSFPATGVPNDLARYCGFFANVNNHNNNNNLSTLPSSAFRLTDAQMDQLRHRSKSWKPAKLAWDNTTCDTIDSHYGVSVGKGNSQLVPCPAPHHPRRFSPRECARIMGFGDYYELGAFKYDDRNPNNANTNVNNSNNSTNTTNKHDGTCSWEPRNPTIATFNGFIKEQYYMLGNAVCPPVIAVLAGSILNHIPGVSVRGGVGGAGGVLDTGGVGDTGGDGGRIDDADADTDGNDTNETNSNCSWIDHGLWTGIRLAIEVVPLDRRRGLYARLTTTTTPTTPTTPTTVQEKINS